MLTCNQFLSFSQMPASLSCAKHKQHSAGFRLHLQLSKLKQRTNQANLRQHTNQAKLKQRTNQATFVACIVASLIKSCFAQTIFGWLPCSLIIEHIKGLPVIVQTHRRSELKNKRLYCLCVFSRFFPLGIT